ncbi:MAG: hypothetical protein JEZ14_22835 [Marinilabiliaceae bacterium]|nr:hypothetical protein [Marinilabiliaceae bacterium]
MLRKTNLLFICFVLLGCGYVISQNIEKKEVKYLVVIDGKEKLWTEKEKRDSINWDKVKSINILSDSIAIKQYGERAKNGTIIVETKKKV